ncbi:MAG: ATP-binding cassette domain-containing protein [Treponema sp.]|nr:ATP-binding cassette domain-containing protein [Treponema sp.]
MSEVVFECQNLVKIYQNKNNPVHAVKGLSLSVNKGEIYGLVGESGSGKSTLGNMLCGLENPTSGQVLYKGRNLSTLNRADFKSFRKNVQMIFQDPYASLNPKHKISNIIGEGLRIHRLAKNPEEEKKLINEMRTLVALPPDSLEKYPSQLSGGQRQRVAIASAMILQPEFVICDECVSSLDLLIQAQILNLLKDMQKSLDLTYFFISHNLNVVAYMADRIGVMYRGQLVEENPTAQLLENPQHPYTKKLVSAADL